MLNNGIILTLAYPETIVMVSDEWFLQHLNYFGIGKKNYVRAGHAALVLIHKETGALEYYDFGRYISPQSTGRVRCKKTDHELDFPIKPNIKDGEIENLEELLIFLATHPKLTHGNGTMYASVCDEVNFENSKAFITSMQERHFIRYAAFIKDATNCARFVTDALIAGVTNISIRKKLIKSKWFTPSTLGNVVFADTNNKVYKLSETGKISIFKSSVSIENKRLFLDRLKSHHPNLVGNLQPKYDVDKHDKAQWLSGIGGGAWFELHDLNHEVEYRFRRISPYGQIDVDGIYGILRNGFEIHSNYAFTHHSNCKYFHVRQFDVDYRFEFLRLYK
jgi:hypothetical protein